MENTIKQQAQQITHQKDEGKKLRDQIRDKERLLSCFKTDLENIVKDPSMDTRKWPAAIRQMYQSHVIEEGPAQSDEQLPGEELQRQMRLLERKISTLASNGNRKETAARLDLQQKAQENSTLIRELNELRVEKKALHSSVRNLEGKLKEAERRVEQLQLEVPGAQGALPALQETAAPLPPRGLPPDAGRPASQPRMPVDGGQGPRQTRRIQAQPARLMMGSGSTDEAKGASLARSASPASQGSRGGSLRKGPSAHMSAEEKQRMQSLLLTVDLNNQQLQMQKLENKILRDQLEKAQKEKQAAEKASGSGSGDQGGAAAGSGAAAARRVGGEAPRSAATLATVEVPRPLASQDEDAQHTPEMQRSVQEVGDEGR